MNTDLVKTMGGKVTKHKLTILELFDMHKHLDANQIYALLNTTDEHISLATIYRVLSAFESSGVIIKNNFNNDQAVYELAKLNEHHDHLICIKCNRVVEFFDEKTKIEAALEHLNAWVKAEHILFWEAKVNEK